MMFLRSRLLPCLLAVAACATALASQIAHAATVVNPVSAFLIDVDGVFSGGVSSGAINGEWSDVAPLAFISPPPTAADLLGIEAAVGFGPSPLTALSHMLIELEVALTIPAGAGDGDPFSTGGVGDPNNGYSPEPAFWGAEAKNNAIDPPISAAIFTIDPATGTTTASSDLLLQQIEVPEPTTAMLLGPGLVGLAGA